MGCQSAYYSAAEQVGIHKRDILVDRVEESRDAQQEAEEQFQSALEQFSVLVNFDGGELEDVYEDLNAEYEDSAAAADEVRERIDAVEHVAEALFEEWADEIEEYSNARLKSESQRQWRLTRQRYDGMIKVMRKAESRMDPVLVALKDNVLFLKHNLNAQAIASLKREFRAIEQDVEVLIAEMRKAIASSDAFIDSMKGQ
jgi:prophage DNA circulation protein